MENPNAVYGIDSSRYDISYEQYMNAEKSFGKFSADYETYTVTDKNTPRQWFNFMVNDNYACVAANNGAGLSAYKTFDARLTKYSNAPGDYLLRDLNGRRKVIIKNLSTGKEFDLLSDCENLCFTVKPGEVTYSGALDGVEFSVNLFVPNEKTCEFWIIELKSVSGKDYELKVGLDVALAYQVPFGEQLHPDCKIFVENGAYYGACDKFLEGKSLAAVFSMPGGEVSYTNVTEKGRDGEIKPYSEVYISKNVSLVKPSKTYALFGAADTLGETKELIADFSDEKEIEEQKRQLFNTREIPSSLSLYLPTQTAKWNMVSICISVRSVRKAFWIKTCPSPSNMTMNLIVSKAEKLTQPSLSPRCL